MATLWITEYQSTALGAPGAVAPVAMEPGTDQTVTYTTSTQSAAFGANTRFIRMIASADCHIVVGANPTSTATKQKLIGGVEYWRGVVPTQKVAVYDGSS